MVDNFDLKLKTRKVAREAGKVIKKCAVVVAVGLAMAIGARKMNEGGVKW